MPDPSATPSTLEKLRLSTLPSTNIGDFRAGPDLEPSKDKYLSGLRGSSLKPVTGSFAEHLKEVLLTELKAAGLYDPESDITVEGFLTESEVDAAIETGLAKLGAIFIVKKENRVVYEKELKVESKWVSSFMGAVAIPKAVDQYSALYKKLALKLFEDQEFLSAVNG